MAVDLNKLLNPLPEKMTLARLALEINELGKVEGAAVVAIGLRLTRVREVLKPKERNFSKGTGLEFFHAWCDANIVSRLGTPYSHKTLAAYRGMAANAGWHKRQQHRSKQSMVKIQEAAKTLRAAQDRANNFTPVGMNPSEEVGLAMTAWEENLMGATMWGKMTARARADFIKLIA